MYTDVGGPGMAHGPAHQRAAGFALVEVLLCALLVAFGAAGLAAGLRAAWGAAGSAVQAAQAVARVSDLAESLRAARPAVRPVVAAAWQVEVSSMGSGSQGAVGMPGADAAGSGVPVWRAKLAWSGRGAVERVRLAQPLGIAR